MRPRTHVWVVTEPGTAFEERIILAAFEPTDNETDSDTLNRAMRFAHTIAGGDVVAVPLAPALA